MTTEIIVKAYYRKNSDEECFVCAPSIARAAKVCRGEYEEIDYVIEVEKDARGEVVMARNVLAEFETEWIYWAQQELEEDWNLGAKLEYDGTLEAFLDRAEGPLLRRPSIRISRGFNAAHVLDAAE